jgi:hypothetical protein
MVVVGTSVKVAGRVVIFCLPRWLWCRRREDSSLLNIAAGGRSFNSERSCANEEVDD